VALQVCSEDFASLEELLSSDYVRDPKKKISDLVAETIAKTGEKVEITKFVKYSVL
jgi:translation elongation factor EF-Ts